MSKNKNCTSFTKDLQFISDINLKQYQLTLTCNFKLIVHSVARWLSPKPAKSCHEKLLDPAKKNMSQNFS